MLLLGAGASRPFGYPTCAEFFSQPELSEPAASEAFRAIASALDVKDEPVQADVEDVLSITTMLAQYEPQGSDPTPVAKYVRTILSGASEAARRALQQAGGLAPNDAGRRNLIAQLESLGPRWIERHTTLDTQIRCGVVDVYSRPPIPECLNAYPELFHQVLRNLGQSALPVFTTNYDTTIEYCMDRFEVDDIGFEFIDGFPAGRRFEPTWNPAQYGNFLAAFRDTGPMEKSDGKVALFKLHGSVNWIYGRGDQDYLVVRTAPGRNVRLDRHPVLYPAFKGVPKDEVFRFSHLRFRECLMEARVCLSIGYTFRDWYINLLLDDAVRYNPRLRIAVMDPSPEALEGTAARLRDVGIPSDRITPIPRAFGPSGTAETILSDAMRVPSEAGLDTTSSSPVGMER